MSSGLLGLSATPFPQQGQRHPLPLALRLEGLGVSLDRAREIAVRDELDAIERCIEEAQSYLTQIQVLHQGALDEFNRAQGE
jgi:hypothetical protein